MLKRLFQKRVYNEASHHFQKKGKNNTILNNENHTDR